jgi:hypothetical protein
LAVVHGAAGRRPTRADRARSGGRRRRPTVGAWAVGRWGPRAGAAGRRPRRGGRRGAVAGEGRERARQGLAATAADDRLAARRIEREKDREQREDAVFNG